MLFKQLPPATWAGIETVLGAVASAWGAKLRGGTATVQAATLMVGKTSVAPCALVSHLTQQLVSCFDRGPPVAIGQNQRQTPFADLQPIGARVLQRSASFFQPPPRLLRPGDSQREDELFKSIQLDQQQGQVATCAAAGRRSDRQAAQQAGVDFAGPLGGHGRAFGRLRRRLCASAQRQRREQRATASFGAASDSTRLGAEGSAASLRVTEKFAAAVESVFTSSLSIRLSSRAASVSLCAATRSPAASAAASDNC